MEKKSSSQIHKEEQDKKREKIIEDIRLMDDYYLSKVETYIEKLKRNRLRPDVDIKIVDYPYNCFMKTEARYYALALSTCDNRDVIEPELRKRLEELCETDHRLNKIHYYYESYHSQKEVAKKFGISQGTINKYHRYFLFRIEREAENLLRGIRYKKIKGGYLAYMENVEMVDDDTKNNK